jgi:hypothetical protein
MSNGGMGPAACAAIVFGAMTAVVLIITRLLGHG